MSPKEIDTLRKEVKKLMIDVDLDVRKRGSMETLAADLSARTGRQLSRTNLSMALSGYRTTPAYQAILQELQAMLVEKAAPPT